MAYVQNMADMHNMHTFPTAGLYISRNDLVYLETRTLNFRLTGNRDPESRKGAVASPEEVAEKARWIQNHRRQPLVEEGFELTRRTVECPCLRRPQARISEPDNQFEDYLRKICR
jgi:hypothetical protein